MYAIVKGNQGTSKASATDQIANCSEGTTHSLLHSLSAHHARTQTEAVKGNSAGEACSHERLCNKAHEGQLACLLTDAQSVYESR